MTDKIILILINGMIYAAFHAWTNHTVTGQMLKRFLTTWKTDSLLHLILCAGSVFILSACAILALGLTLRELGI